MVHGTMDAQAPIEQSEAMDAALTRAGKPHRFVRVTDSDHAFSEVKDKVTLMREIEGFLSEHLPAAGSATPAGTELHQEVISRVSGGDPVATAECAYSRSAGANITSTVSSSSIS